MNNDEALLGLVRAIVADDPEACRRLIEVQPELASASFHTGATRQTATRYFLPEVGRYIVAGDTALHLAAAGYRVDIERLLLNAGANAHAKNRHGYEPLHAATAGNPDSARWNPAAQSRMIDLLIASGADPNTTDKRGVTPLHIAVRTRCSAAAATLLKCGADPGLANRSGSTPLKLAKLNSGRGGSGSEAAKSEQQQILRLLE